MHGMCVGKGRLTCISEGSQQALPALWQVGDASMQYAVALLGLSIAPAVINALIIVVGELLST